MKKILIPIDGSYKEYKKYEFYFKDKPHWNNMWFVVDETINTKKLKTKNYFKIQVDYNADLADFEKYWKEEDFEEYCIVDLAQNKNLFKNKKEQLKQRKLEYIKIKEFMKSFKSNEWILLNNGTSAFFQRSIRDIAIQLGFENWSYTQALLPGFEFIWIKNERFEIEEAVRHDHNLSYGELSEIIKKGKKIKSFMAASKRSVLDEIKDLSLIINRYQPKQILRIKRLKYFADKFINNKIRAKIWDINSEKEAPDDEFVFFPLHQPNEAQTLIRGNGWIDDVDLAIKISKQLPQKTFLVVKEHPGHEGEKTLKDLKKLKKCKNIYIVKSTYSSHDLIKKCKFVTTINSTVWLEAIIYDKHVATFGVGVFSNKGIVDELKEPAEIQKLLKEYQNSKFDIPGEKLNRRKDFIAILSIPFDKVFSTI